MHATRSVSSPASIPWRRRYSWSRRVVVSAAVIVTALAGSVVPAAAVAAPGAPGIGDVLFPLLGNGGYDVDHYDLSIDYQPATRTFVARTVIEAHATQALSRFDLDFAGHTVRAVTVDGRASGFTRNGQELVVTPARYVGTGRRFRVEVAYTGTPTPSPDGAQQRGWLLTDDGGFFTAPQPVTAHSIFPSNDHPSDKATLSTHLTAPDGWTAAANGVLTGRTRRAGATTWTFAQREPIATELVQLTVGHYAIVHDAARPGLPLRSVVPTADAERLRPVLASTKDQLAWLERRLGRYPFATYGALGVDADITFALETQTLTVFNVNWLTGDGYPESVFWWRDLMMAHELAHQWFGDSVSPRHWSDAWLSEGPATWYGYLYAAPLGGKDFDTIARMMYEGAEDDTYPEPFDGDQALRDEFGPPAAPVSGATLFRLNIYHGGMLTLYALRQEIGGHAFDRLMRTWVTEHRDGTATTAQFIHAASRTAGRDLTGFLTAWLYGPTTPPMPGHPDWRAAR